MIDSNVVIDFSLGKINENGTEFIAREIDEGPIISVINKIELLGFPVVTQEILDFVEAAEILNLTDTVIQKTIKLRKKHKIKLPDAIIAASAIVNKLGLITRNVKDFEKIKGLIVINPYRIS